MPMPLRACQRSGGGGGRRCLWLGEKRVKPQRPGVRRSGLAPDALGVGGAGIPTSVAVLALGRIRLTLLTVYALWRLDAAGMPRRAAAVPADAIGPGTLRTGGANDMGVRLLKETGPDPVDAVVPIASASPDALPLMPTMR